MIENFKATTATSNSTQSKSKLFYCVGDLLDVVSRNYDSSKFSEFYNVKGNKGTEFHIVFVSSDRDDAIFAQY